jgi:excisionase family DNA binding protein
VDTYVTYSLATPPRARTVDGARRLRELRKAAKVVSARTAAPVEIVHGEHRAEVPAELVQLIARALRGLEAGQQLALVVGGSGPGSMLTSQQAADLLNVSRPHVVKLARDGGLRHVRVGNRHRFRLEDVLEYQRAESNRRQELLASMEPDDGFGPDDY